MRLIVCSCLTYSIGPHVLFDESAAMVLFSSRFVSLSAVTLSSGKRFDTKSPLLASK